VTSGDGQKNIVSVASGFSRKDVAVVKAICA
jgi:hypothetical protein